MSEGLRLISSIVSTGSAATLLRMSPEVFTVQEQGVFDFVRSFYRQYRSMPEVATVHQETGVRLPAAQETLAYYVDQVEERHIFNNVRDRYAELRDGLRDRNIEAMRPIIHQMHTAMNSHRERGQQVVGIGAAIQMAVDRLERTQGMGGITGIETPWPTMNEMTGGYQDADLITVVGRPATSKTYNLLYQAMTAHAAGHSVLVVTTEMGIEQLARRYIALRTGVNPDLLKRNMVSTYTMQRIAALQAEMISDTNLRIFSVGMGARISAIEALMQEFGPSIVFLDGTYLVHPSVTQPMKRIERVAEVFDELKGLTITSNTPIVNTMQFNRQAGKGGKDGSLETIGFTDAVGMHSSIVIGLKHGPTEDPRASRTMEFLKGREGEVGEIHTHFRFAPVDMSELPPELIGGNGAAATPGAEGVDTDWMM